jgi:cytochrome c553
MKRLLILVLVAAMATGSACAASAERGKQKSQVCAACHGADGNSVSPDFPRLAGQYEDYLYRALLDYKLGKRKNPIMGAQVANLTKNDFGDLAAYFASQSGVYNKR